MRLKLTVAFVLLFWVLPSYAQRGVFLATDQFIAQSFSQPAELKTLWLTKEARPTAEAIMGHSLPLRTRYYQLGPRTAWILEEVGKELPITVGIVVENGQVAALRVLEYREVRGGEVRHSFFTEQFVGAALSPEKRELSKSIDGISGATLSVRALKKTAALALFFHSQVVTVAP